MHGGHPGGQPQGPGVVSGAAVVSIGFPGPGPGVGGVGVAKISNFEIFFTHLFKN